MDGFILGFDKAMRVLRGVAHATRPNPATKIAGMALDAAAQCGLFARALNLIRAEFQESTWEAFWRTTVEDQPAKDVAADLGISPGAVRVAKCRVLQRLREELGDLME